MRKKVEEDDRFNGKASVFNEVYEKAINNLSPIGEMKNV